jgi:hypothetical protein
MDQQDFKKEIRIKWGSTNNLEYRYANNLVVTHASENEFHIIFGHLVPPNMLNITPEECPDTVEIRPVACLVVSPEKMKDFAKAMSDNYATYVKTMESKNDIKPDNDIEKGVK